VAATYTLPGRCDGLTAYRGRLLASVNEDNNSSLFVITPGEAAPAHFTYSPNPADTGSDGTNGGTDSISVGTDGTIYVAHSNPDLTLPPPANPAAVFTMTLRGATAFLTPLFGINDTAEVANPAPGGPIFAPLGLTDPDSNRFVPDLRGGTLIHVAQADSKLVLASHLHRSGPDLRQLNLTNADQPTGSAVTPQLDDVVEVNGSGTLFAVDQKGGNVYAIDTRGVARGTFFAAQPAPGSGDLPNTAALAVVDLRNGVVTPVDFHLVSPKGLLFVPALFPVIGR